MPNRARPLLAASLDLTNVPSGTYAIWSGPLGPAPAVPTGPWVGPITVGLLVMLSLVILGRRDEPV